MRLPLPVLLTVLGGLLVPAVASADAAITFRSNVYEPKDVRITPGASVSWTPQLGSSFEEHPLRSVSGDGETYQQDTGVGTYTRNFNSAGKFRFYCLFHGTNTGGLMGGAVVVTTNTPPTAAFTVDGTNAATGAFRFDGGGVAGSSDPDMGQTLTYAWDFGDGQSRAASTVPTADHSYARGSTAADYVVRLTVTDSNGDAVGPESKTATRTVTVPAAPPSADGGAPTSSAGGGIATGDRTTPRVTLTVPTRLRTVLSIRSDEAARAALTLRSGKTLLARGRTTFTKAGLRRLTLQRTAAGRRRLARSPRVRAALVLRVVDTAGNATTIRRTVTLRR